MVANYLSLFENFIEKWQSKRKTIVISPAKPSLPAESSSSNFDKLINLPKSNLKENKENTIPECLSNEENGLVRRDNYKSLGDITESQDHKKSLFEKIEMPNLNRPTLVTCPSLLYASIVLFCLLSLSLFSSSDEHRVVAEQQSANSLIVGKHQDWRAIGRELVSRFASHDPFRWAHIPEPSGSIRDVHRRRPENFLTRTLNRIGNRIGSRNTIRVHNAFRDLAWRLLSSFSMPTPVIYELRRQHLYSNEDDLMNDSLFNKNTSKTIRSRRLLWPLNRFERTGRSSDDDEDSPTSLRGILAMRLEDLIKLSRRSLFGRVIRLPVLFPFKRQSNLEETSPSAGKSSQKRTNTRRRRLLGRRKKKEIDRQMISIDGKQYYIDDDGALKELNETSE